jgi:hypothetical protein
LSRWLAGWLRARMREEEEEEEEEEGGWRWSE